VPDLARNSRRTPNLTQDFVPEAGAIPFPGYKLLRLRGRGGFATVWEAEGPDSQRVALKFLSTQNTGSTTRELRSFQALQPLSHPNLLKTYHVWSLPSMIVISMELADASLLDLLMLYVEEFGKPLEPEKLCLYMVQTAQALDFLNARKHRVDGRLVGLQHGDIKPNNILLINDTAKLADYGLAAPTFGPNTPCPRHGTVEFCAPEVFNGQLTDWSDQFSLAVTYCVLRTGAFPYPTPPMGKDGLVKGYQRPEPNLAGLTLPERAPVARALSAIPQQRFPNCGLFMSAILSALRLRAITNSDDQLEIVNMRDKPGSSTEFVV
jgi:serine/threonine protein kinase